MALVRQCLEGNEEAWSALIDKYKNLIFSIPIKYGFSSDDATDIFQSVCLALLSELPRIREPRALAAWIMQTTARKCFRWRDEQRRYPAAEVEEEKLPDEAKISEEMLHEIQREQLLREAIAELSPDCQRLVELLFFQPEPLNYDDVAKALGTAKGSIGPTRMRCLEKLRRSLEKKGF